MQSIVETIQNLDLQGLLKKIQDYDFEGIMVLIDHVKSKLKILKYLSDIGFALLGYCSNAFQALKKITNWIRLKDFLSYVNKKYDIIKDIYQLIKSSNVKYFEQLPVLSALEAFFNGSSSVKLANCYNGIITIGKAKSNGIEIAYHIKRKYGTLINEGAININALEEFAICFNADNLECGSRIDLAFYDAQSSSPKNIRFKVEQYGVVRLVK